MPIFKGCHIFTGPHCFFQHKHLVAGPLPAQAHLLLVYRALLDRGVLLFLAFLHVVFPAAGVGTGVLIGVALVNIAGKQAAAGESSAGLKIISQLISDQKW
ncbi:hypothetical protein BN437_2337 [Erwinia amylovora NBRC 12687 = CFBP 1232]|uniref:Uncharacterized protein n=1 Tax=Erwinia amylovora NBRC 12687 = CFBP 1232 TaxID=1219359 RepID=A0A830ZU27_ERWAM|nr:hypothetical protein BN432_2336 [Erwinia amylovora Ea356]CCO94256.1 hypothetical protein BN437_2337 [Erwinia amylovora NBRC 12687 = CFBP 1232]